MNVGTFGHSGHLSHTELAHDVLWQGGQICQLLGA